VKATPPRAFVNRVPQPRKTSEPLPNWRRPIASTTPPAGCLAQNRKQGSHGRDGDVLAPCRHERHDALPCPRRGCRATMSRPKRLRIHKIVQGRPTRNDEEYGHPRTPGNPTWNFWDSHDNSTPTDAPLPWPKNCAEIPKGWPRQEELLKNHPTTEKRSSLHAAGWTNKALLGGQLCLPRLAGAFPDGQPKNHCQRRETIQMSREPAANWPPHQPINAPQP